MTFLINELKVLTFLSDQKLNSLKIEMIIHKIKSILRLSTFGQEKTM